MRRTPIFIASVVLAPDCVFEVLKCVNLRLVATFTVSDYWWCLCSGLAGWYSGCSSGGLLLRRLRVGLCFILDILFLSLVGTQEGI